MSIFVEFGLALRATVGMMTENNEETTDARPAIETMTLEQCFAELEQIVEALEDQTTSLENSISLFERGMKLSKRCNTDLTRIERKIQVIIADSKNEAEPQVKDFKPGA